MERLVIDIPEKKSTEVKQMLRDMGVTIQQESHVTTSDYKQKLTTVSTWSADDVKFFEESKKVFENLKPQQW
ncbi:hypothetical protein [Mucilaginibacter sp. UYCu711]|uniref:hypothetical protein n=1 Tax=Mucilaginibacter sp. UYCu711 TaxID=3156339 RepID=UPI003D1E7EF4